MNLMITLLCVFVFNIDSAQIDNLKEPIAVPVEVEKPVATKGVMKLPEGFSFEKDLGQEDLGAKYHIDQTYVATSTYPKDPEGYLINSLWYGDQEIFSDLDQLLGMEYSDFSNLRLWNSFSKAGEDHLFIVIVAGCDFCVIFFEKYFVINRNNGAIELVDVRVPPFPFKSPRGFFSKGLPILTAVSPDHSKMFYVREEGDSDWPSRADYFQEVWIYSFIDDVWSKYFEVPKDQNLHCLNGSFPFNKVYWAEDSTLKIEPYTLEEAFSNECGNNQ